MPPSFGTSFSQTVRSLARRPLYAFLTLGLFALGLGAGATIVAVVDATILRPLPYREPSRLFAIRGAPRNDPANAGAISALQLLEWRETSRAFEGIEAHTPVAIKLTGNADPESLRGAQVSAGLFRLLGVAPRAGRDFRPEEEAAGSGVAIISDGLWTRRFARDPDVVGRTFSLNDEPRTIIGVMPAGFAPLFQEEDVWVPIPLGPALLALTNFRNLIGVGRLRPGFTLEEATADLETGSRQLGADWPAIYGNTVSSIVPLKDFAFGTIRPQVVGLSIAVALLLLIACAHAMNLSLADSAARRQEAMTRIALGANRRDVMWRRLQENVLLATVAGVVGLGLGRLGLLALQSVNRDAFAGFSAIGINPVVAALLMTAAVVVGIITGIPAAAADAAQGGTMASTASRTTMSRTDRRVRDGLITGQVAMAIVLVIGAVLLAENVRRLLATSPGFDARNVLVAPLSMSAQRYPTADDRAGYVDRVLRALRAVPGVEAAATTQTRFVLNENMQTLFEIEGRPPVPGQDHIASIRHVTPGIFTTLGTRILEGVALTMLTGRTLSESRWSAGRSRHATGRESPPWASGCAGEAARMRRGWRSSG